MKKTGIVCSVFMIAAISFSGCGVSTNVDTSTIYIGSNGKITEVTVEDFDKDYYDEDELKEYIDEAVEAYKNDGGQGSVSVKKYAVKDNTVKMSMEYDSYGTYAAFNEAQIYVGTVIQAKAEGYEFPETFYTPDQTVEESTENAVITEESADGTEIVVNGTLENTATTYQPNAADDVLADEKNQVLILKQDTDVQVSGEILYVSDHVKVTGKNTATIYGEGTDSADAEMAYIIYK